MRESYKYKLWHFIEKLGWLVVPVPASGGGRRGVHRPDVILGNNGVILVAEVKNSRLPLYLNFRRDIQPVIEYSRMLKATPILIVKRKYDSEWLVFNLATLEKCSEESYVINKYNISKGIPLQKFLTEFN
ncbi:MAG: hypothetical protein OdinLCB4_002350 [Candidatus Odinarchaeum yellowstonii]|uniref:Holliday junction resolvase n=1 Tax=Odinarchaeota yellowstonii (strain LCB_4) TaxID=1841599 RepID=A0AAF0ID47_ODILC|nr:MAG: hypothetical protein OdinLCB4_002350 [Candidatus Odinarchaeum yellowstonii]